MSNAVRGSLAWSRESRSRRSRRCRSSFADDVRAYAAAGLDGIGIWELKLAEGGDAEALELLEASGLDAAAAVPAVPSILPLPLLGGPDDPAERIEALCALARAARAVRPTGRLPDRHRRRAATPTRRAASSSDGLRTIGAEAERLGLRIALEPYQRDGGELWTIVSSIPEAVALIEDAGEPPALGIQFDVWHLWNTPTLYDDIAARARTASPASTSATMREPTRGWADRALPGEGSPTFPASCARSTRRAGTACTTSRSSPTTARSETSTRTRSGQRRRRRRSHVHARRSSGAGHAPDPPGSGGDDMRRRSSRAGLVAARRRGRARCARSDSRRAHDDAQGAARSRSAGRSTARARWRRSTARRSLRPSCASSS